MKSEGLESVLRDITKEAINLKAPVDTIENLEALAFLAQMGIIQITPNVRGGRRSNKDRE